MNTGLAGRRVVVTGASRGMGRAIAIALAEHGARVAVNATDAERLATTVGAIEAAGGTGLAVPGSVADEDVAERLVASCVERFGGVDCLVNNAGIVRDRTLLKMDVAELDEVFAVHVRGTFLCSRAAARAMKDAGGGQIINVVSAFEGQIGQSNYAAAKAAVASFVRSWSVELARYGIRVNGFWPVAVTDMTEGMVARLQAQATPEGAAPPSAADLGFGDPALVAQAVVHLVSDGFTETGEIVCFNGKRLWRWTFPGTTAAVSAEHWDLDTIAAALSGLSSGEG